VGKRTQEESSRTTSLGQGGTNSTGQGAEEAARRATELKAEGDRTAMKKERDKKSPVRPKETKKYTGN